MYLAFVYCSHIKKSLCVDFGRKLAALDQYCNPFPEIVATPKIREQRWQTTSFDISILLEITTLSDFNLGERSC